ncbi:hypothetical protein N2152v2_003617 [Parachlorella kessleri]
MLQGPLAYRVPGDGLQAEKQCLAPCDCFLEDAYDDLLDLNDLLSLDDLDSLLEDPLREALPNDCADPSFPGDTKQGSSSWSQHQHEQQQPSPPIQADLLSSPFDAAATSTRRQDATKESSAAINAAQLRAGSSVALGGPSSAMNSPQSPSTTALLQRYWQLRQLEAGCGSASGHRVQTADRVSPTQPARVSAWLPCAHLRDAASHCRQSPATGPAASASDPKWRLQPFTPGQPVLRPVAATTTMPSCLPLPGAIGGSQRGVRGLSRASSEPYKSHPGGGPMLQSRLAALGCHSQAAGLSSGFGEGTERRQPAKRPRVETMEPPRKHGCKLPHTEQLASLELQNALLRRQVHTLRDTMRLWCTQGFVSQKQAFHFLAQLAAAKA